MHLHLCAGIITFCLNYHTPEELEQLSEEFSMYQLMEDNEIPQGIWDAATVKEDNGKCYYRMDILWHFLSTLKMPDGFHCFGRLAKVAKLVLVIPHSNAESFLNGSQEQNSVPS